MPLSIPFDALLDALPQQAWQADAQGHLLWMNARLAEVLGRPALPTLMAHWLQPEDQAGFVAAWAQAQGGDRFEREYRFAQRWVLAQARRLPGTALWVGTHTDISHRRAADDVWKLALECAGDGVWDWHVQERTEHFSPGFMRLYGFEPGEVDANPRVFDGRTHPDDIAQMARDREDHFAGRTPLYRNEHRVRAKDGTWKWVLSRGLVISRDAAGQPLRMVGTHVDITEQKALQARAWQQARLDGLTGLPNRRALRERMSRWLAQRADGEQLAVLFVDLDHFKEVNDSLGHDAGDDLLVKAAQRLQHCLPPAGVVARMGGDEFTVLLPATDASAAARDAGHCILEAMAHAFEVGGRRVYVSASIGMSLAPRDGTEIESLFKHADQALYEAKGAGRNRMSEFTPALQEAADRRVQLAGELREALGRGQLSLAYQPILSLQRPAAPPRKAEALLRWTHPQLGHVSPAQFIPVAEASGLIVDIGDWVFHEAASQVQAWRAAGHGDFQVSINKSPVQFRSERTPGLRPDWVAHLQALKLPGNALAIEITESLLLDRDDEVAARLRGLREAGVSISLDDFGTGFSALSYLQHHPIDIIKIDRSFVAGIETSAKSLALCKAIVTMAHELGMEVVAEGVETEAQMVALREMGCDWGQGWWFGKGVCAGEFEARWFGADAAGSVGAATR